MPQSEIGYLATLQLQLQFISNQRNEFGVRGFSLGITDSIAEETLESIQIASVPGYFDGMADGPFHTGRGSLEGFCHLWIEDFRDGVRVPDGPLRGCQ